MVFPIGCLNVFNHIDPPIFQMWEQDFKGLYDVFVVMASVIDDDIERTYLGYNALQKWLVHLATSVNFDPILLEGRFVVNVN